MNFKRLLLVFISGITLLSCYRPPNDTVFNEDLDLVITNYEDINYGAEYETYRIADSFSLVSNVKDFTLDDANDPKLRSTIKGAIADAMDAYGYVLTTDTPDIYIPVTISYINTKGVTYYPIYSPGWGWGYGYPGYGYGYGYGWGGYYSWGYIPTTFNYDQGSVLVDWLDLKNRKPPLSGDTIWRVETVWNMGISGLIENSKSTSDRDNRLEAAISKGFEQSPYLKK